ncbi:MAG TPA: hypothetical protein VFO60_01220 [Candidatus Dormibacteraeota bacterium]|nr:hypothetical protein [Candidatus Dormibacteraeota bacterium]
MAAAALGAILAVGCADGSGDADGPAADAAGTSSTAVATPSPTPQPTPRPSPRPARTPKPHTPAPVVAAGATMPPAIVVNAGPVYAVGDSVTLDIANPLRADVPGVVVDGQVGRQFSVGISIIAGLRSAGRLPPMVIVALGTNGTVTAQQIDQMMSAATGARRVVFVTVHVPRVWQDSDNAVIRAGVTRYPNAGLADWNALSAGHPAWFAPDGYHLSTTGATALARLIAAAL